MADMYAVSKDKIIAIANKIRSKTGKTANMTIDDMPTEIESISGGGGSFKNIVTDGVLSRIGAYGTVDLTGKLDDVTLIVLKLKDTVNGVDYEGYYSFVVSALPDTTPIQFLVPLHTPIYLGITKTTLSCLNYAGAWYEIFVDIDGINIPIN